MGWDTTKMGTDHGFSALRRRIGIHRNAPSAEGCAAALETGGGPQTLRIVIGVEGRNRRRQRHPGQLRACVDVDVRLQPRRIVERADADEAEGGNAAIDAPHCRLAARTTDNLVWASAVGRYRNGGGVTREEG